MNNKELSNLDLAYQKLAFLEKKAILVVDSATQFQLRYEIEELKKEIANLENQPNSTQQSNHQLKWFHYRWWIAGAIIILILLGLFLKIGNTSINGDCNAIISGSVGGNFKQDCLKK
jgi:hypothetical protein